MDGPLDMGAMSQQNPCPYCRVSLNDDPHAECRAEALRDAVGDISPGPRFTKNDLHAIDRIIFNLKPNDPHKVYRKSKGFYIENDFTRLENVRSLLESVQDAPAPYSEERVRTTDPELRVRIAMIIARRVIHPNEVFLDGPYRSVSERDRCEHAADEIIAELASTCRECGHLISDHDKRHGCNNILARLTTFEGDHIADVCNCRAHPSFPVPDHILESLSISGENWEIDL